MAKPVVGYIGYDADADRPTAKLVVGERYLLTEDDLAGGGSLTGADSPDGSITVTNPSGPTVSLDVNEAALENGGSHELNVAGLSGELADPQRADTLVESSGPTDLGVGSISAGQLLARSGSSVIGVDSPTASEWWSPKGGAEDQEFTGSSLPSGWAFGNATDWTTPIIVGTPSILSGLATTDQLRADFNVKKSHARVQVPDDAKSYVLYRALPVGAVNYTLRTRVQRWHELASVAGMKLSLFIAADSGNGVPNLTASAGSGGAAARGYVSCGWENGTTAGTWFLQGRGINSAGTTTLDSFRPLVGSNQTPLYDMELMLIVTGGNFKYFVNGHSAMEVFTATNTAFTPAFFGVVFQQSATLGAVCIHAVDYVRYEATNDPVF